MSTIYSAGQYDDAFSPKRLGNWEACSKSVCPSLQLKPHYPGPGGTTQVIVDEKGHLLPGFPRNKSTAWGLLQYYMRNTSVSNMAMMSGPGKPRQEAALDTPSFPHEKSTKKLPRFFQKKPRSYHHQQDILMEYLKELRLPIVWIIGPATKGIFNKRKQFSRQLAKSLSFGYVNLDEKIQEWKERQTVCACSATPLRTKSSTSIAYGNTLALTSIAPSKLPISVPPELSENLPSPRGPSAAPDISELLDTQRITFDTALPIERNKILELYKFAMAECLPCEGFVCDSVPFDLVEGLAFEKSFYPAALAIYFAEGIPQKKQLKTKDYRLATSSMTTPGLGSCKKMLGPLQYLEFCKKAKAAEHVYLRTKNHKRLGSFSLTEAEKICRQFGSKTIRITNAEEVERDTMEFLNELVKKNLGNYQQILEGNAKLDCSGTDCGRHYFRLSSSSTLAGGQVGNQNQPPSAASSHCSYTSSFIPEGQEDEVRQAKSSNKPTPSVPVPATELDTSELNNLTSAPKLASGKSSQTSIPMFNFPNMFQAPHQVSQTSAPLSPQALQENKKNKDDTSFAEEVGAGDLGPEIENISSLSRKQSFELLQKINKLESKVAELNPEEKNSFPSTDLEGSQDSLNAADMEHTPIPPPTAYADEDEVETLTSVIRRAIARQTQSVSQRRPQEHISEQNYDFGAAGDYTNVNPMQVQRREGKPDNDPADASEDLLFFEEQFVLLETDLKRKLEKGREKSRPEDDME